MARPVSGKSAAAPGLLRWSFGPGTAAVSDVDCNAGGGNHVYDTAAAEVVCAVTASTIGCSVGEGEADHTACCNPICDSATECNGNGVAAPTADESSARRVTALSRSAEATAAGARRTTTARGGGVSPSVKHTAPTKESTAAISSHCQARPSWCIS